MAGRGTCEAWKPRSYAEMQHRMAVGVRHRPPLGPASEKARGDHPQEAGGGIRWGMTSSLGIETRLHGLTQVPG